MTPSFTAALVVTAVALSSCSAGASTTGSAATGATSQSPSTTASPARHKAGKPTRHRSRRRPASTHRRGSLAYSTASNNVVQPQPATGSCHAIGSGLYSRPDPACTPGVLDPAVTQATIDQTICVVGWTETVRPPESVTEQEKAASIAAYGDAGSLGDYEYDHFVPLELGGATNDPRNLWPEPGASPNPKDTVEDDLREQVCDRQLTLAAAQHEIVTNWITLARHANAPATTTPSSPATRESRCTVTASYSSHYHDYDVYVHSNQPAQAVTVTDADGHSGNWHTDSSGYADVYFKSGGYAPGRRITAHVGAASCSTTL